MCICVKFGAWNVSSFDAEQVRELEQAGYGALCARILSARGYGDPAAARDYLRGDAPLHSPFLMKDMKTAADRVRLAVARKEHIAVFGDYDVDGITSTALLTEFLRGLGARVTPYIPARLEEGYGLNELAIRWLYKQQVNLIVTVDCGITANREAELCRKLGMDLVITDHHECKEELPKAVAVVDPHQPDCGYPHTNLSGVGIAFQLAAAISGDQAGLLERFADLLCLGLIADVMPLQGEVRTMVVRGLNALARPARPGLAALMEECGCLGGPVTTSTVGYLLAPRINAAGRMGQVEQALELFMTRDPARARSLAESLCRLNRERQRVEAGIYQQAVAMLGPDAKPHAIVLAGETWHQGVVGIVASRLSEEYSCPAFLICMDKDRGKASSRSYGGFNLFGALTQLSDLLESFGGHELAAGFTISRENVPAFRRAVTALAEEFQSSGQADTALQVDCAVDPALLTQEHIQELAQLEPCGTGCPIPVLCVEDATVVQLSEVGGGKHLRLSLRCRNGQSLAAIFFSQTALRAGVSQGDTVDVAFTPQINEFRGSRTVQLNVVDLRLSRQLRTQTEQERDLYSRFSRQEKLSPDEAEQLLPNRGEFVAVWRYLIANSREDRLQDNFACMSRKIIRTAAKTLTLCKTRICLDVFAEQGLIDLDPSPRCCRIRITTDGRKVDLDQSPIVKALRAAKSGARP
ncbi:MAG: single-stranded-DNA-specific exonuclease RecJ [Oscillospiraceae bacterium]|nr:single-stranded-DNA-specific exonuclease RecJ [Oscillospiraceae bacterium]